MAPRVNGSAHVQRRILRHGFMTVEVLSMALVKRVWGRAAARMNAAAGEPGQGLAEYALILTFVALACVVALGALGQGIATSPGFSIFP